MKISINNFKAIGVLDDYQIKPLTVLSGTNSSGKSSFIQLILLIKQTVDIDSSRIPLHTQGQLFKVKELKDIVKGKKEDSEISFSLTFNKSDFNKYKGLIASTLFDGLSDYTCKFKVIYKIKAGQCFVQTFKLQYQSVELSNEVSFEQIDGTGRDSIINSDNEYFIKRFYDEVPEKINKIHFSGFFPTAVEFTRYLPSIDRPDEINERSETEYTNLRAIKQLTENIFNELFYVGPLRVEPKDNYIDSGNMNWVGAKGENTASLLEKRAKDILDLMVPQITVSGISFKQAKMSLVDATNLWICEIFKLGKRIFATEKGETYSVYLVNENDLHVSIKHVGFGISQILPIVVQGLLMAGGGILILEQPEIHLHPKIQCLLFDFLYSLALVGKVIIVETHSDHFITRLRRRIAESDDDMPRGLINLTFIEPGKKDVLFRSLVLDEYGLLTYFPEDFIDRQDEERKAIVSAQMKKRLKK